MSYLQKGATNQTQHLEAYYSKQNSNAGAADKIVSFLINDKEVETRGRTKHNHALQQVPESGRFKAAEVFIQNLPISNSEQSNRNADKMKAPGIIQKKNNIPQGRSSRDGSSDQNLVKNRSASQCSHYVCRSQSVTKPFQKCLNPKTLSYEINPIFVCQDWKEGICEKGYDCEKQHFYFLKMGQWNTDLRKNLPNQQTDKSCVNKGIEIQQEDPAHCVVIRTVETKLVSAKQALALFKGSARESAYRYEISVAVTNEQAMEEFQKEVIRVSHNNGNKKAQNNDMDGVRANLWRQHRKKLSANINEYDDSINTSCSVSESSYSQCSSQGKNSSNEVINYLLQEVREMSEKLNELSKSATSESKNTKNQTKKHPNQHQQQQKQQNQQFQEVKHKQSIQIISIPPHPTKHGQMYIPAASLNNEKQQSQKQKSQKIPETNSKTSCSQKQAQPKAQYAPAQYVPKNVDSSDVTSYELSLTDKETNEIENKQNCVNSTFFNKNYQELYQMKNKLISEEQSIFQEDQYFRDNELALKPWYNGNGAQL